VCLHNDENRSKLVCFKEQNFLQFLKTLTQGDFCHSVRPILRHFEKMTPSITTISLACHHAEDQYAAIHYVECHFSECGSAKVKISLEMTLLMTISRFSHLDMIKHFKSVLKRGNFGNVLLIMNDVFVLITPKYGLF
jgi:hypothetical protein